MSAQIDVRWIEEVAIAISNKQAAYTRALSLDEIRSILTGAEVERIKRQILGQIHSEETPESWKALRLAISRSIALLTEIEDMNKHCL